MQHDLDRDVFLQSAGTTSKHKHLPGPGGGEP